MANIHVDASPLIAKNTPYPATVGDAPTKIRAAKAKAPQIAGALEANASALANIQGSLNNIHATLRQQTPSVQQVYVTDNTGKVIAAIGDFEYQGVVTPNYFSEIHVGDPLNTGNPALALFNAANGNVTIGQNGAIEVLDPFGNDAAWIGTQPDTEAVTNAVNNGSGLIRLTITGHTYVTGDTPTFTNVGGVPNATGIFAVTVIDANTVDLQNSVFVGTYTSGGTGTRILHVSNAANNGSGLIRITITAHGYVTGDEVNVVAVGGVPAADGQWVITVIDANNFDLQGSTFGGTYTSGGTCLRYFAGMLAQTIAIGPSFPNYKLRAFADGSLQIQNATITLSNGVNSVVISPDGTLGGPEITSTDAEGTSNVYGSGFNLYDTFSRQVAELFISSLHGEGVLTLRSFTTGTPGFTLDPNVGLTALGTNQSITLATTGSGVVTASGDINAVGVFRKGGTPGISPTITYGISLSLVTVSNAVRGTPGTGQSNFTAVSSVTLNTASNTFSGGIITA